MVVDDAMLRAYVDGELEADLRQQVEAAVANSAALQGQVQASRASCLPYRAAFDAQALPAPPASLTRHLADLLAVAESAPGAARPAAAANGPRRAWLVAGLAASFGVGLVVSRLPGALSARFPAPAEPQPWVEAIAQYHALYVRATVDAAPDAPADLQGLLSGFDASWRQRLRIPDLVAQGLVFKRVQRLGYRDAPLIQMVYLPAQGRPVAVCLLPVAGPSTGIYHELVGSQSVATWREDGLAFVVVGDLPTQAMQRLAPAIRSQLTL
ncbi:MAG: anti-sigma factor [Rubrivivax sp.]|jgi:anti-sigma factor RsiW|nr:anti-sigma factor [Rubrivivax sp.]